MFLPSTTTAVAATLLAELPFSVLPALELILPICSKPVLLLHGSSNINAGSETCGGADSTGAAAESRRRASDRSIEPATLSHVGCFCRARRQQWRRRYWRVSLSRYSRPWS